MPTSICDSMSDQHQVIESCLLAAARHLDADAMDDAVVADRGAALAAKAALHAALANHDEQEESICAGLDRGLHPGARAELVAALAH